MGAGISMIIIGIIILICFSTVFKKVPNQAKAKGIIVSVEYYKHSKGKSKYYGYVQYFADGKEYCLKTHYASSNFRVGRKLLVRYNQESPEEAFLATTLTTTIVSSLFILLGISCIAQTLNISYLRFLADLLFAR